MKFLSIIGTRPQYIKVLDNLPNHVIADTRQHYDEDLSDVFIKQLKIRAKYKLGAIELGEMIKKSEEIIGRENPDIVIVYGDTRSTLAGALAAKFAGKTLAHIEAGMRSGDMKQPEEIIRVIVDRISDFKFCVNDFARKNLKKEGIFDNVYVVGDAMGDALNKVTPGKKTKDYRKFILVTIHRPQNTDNPEALRNIIEALGESGEKIIFPIHPRTKRALKKNKIKIPKNIELLKPQGYKEMVILELNAKKIITDSGGVQREAYWFTVPVIIPRWETEWNEIIEDGWGILVGNKKESILDAIKNHNPSIAHNHRNYLPEFGAKSKIAKILLT